MLAGLIRTIGTVILVWFVFRWLDRVAKRWSNRKPSGEDVRSSKPSQNGQNSPQDSNLGDYVDFEELKDKD